MMSRAAKTQLAARVFETPELALFLVFCIIEIFPSNFSVYNIGNKKTQQDSIEGPFEANWKWKAKQSFQNDWNGTELTRSTADRNFYIDAKNNLWLRPGCHILFCPHSLEFEPQPSQITFKVNWFDYENFHSQLEYGNFCSQVVSNSCQLESEKSRIHVERAKSCNQHDREKSHNYNLFGGLKRPAGRFGGL